MNTINDELKVKKIGWIDNLLKRKKTTFKNSQGTYFATSLASSTCELPENIFIELEVEDIAM